MLQRCASDRQHVCLGFKATPRVFRTDLIRQTLQHVDPNRTGARNAVSGHGVIAFRGIHRRGNCHQPGRRAFREFRQITVQRPEQQAQPRRSWLEQKRHENRKLAKANAMLAQRTAHVLIKGLHILGHLIARQNAQRLYHAEGKPPGQPGQRLVLLQRLKRLKQRGDLAIKEMLETARHLFSNLGPGLFIHEDFNPWLERFRAFDQLANRMLAPHETALFGKVDLRVGGIVKPVRAQGELRRQRCKSGLAHCLCLIRAGGFILMEAKSLKATQYLSFNCHFAVFVHLGHKALLLLQSAQQHRCTPVHKPVGQCAV